MRLVRGRAPGSLSMSTLFSRRQMGVTVLLCASGFVGPFAIGVVDDHVWRSPFQDSQGEK
jgi:hypothetical protein